MICRCCLAEINGDSSCCPVCGYPLMSISDNEHKAEMEQAISDYRRNLLKAFSVSVKTYTYKLSGGVLSAPIINSAKLADGKSLEFGVTVWSEREFASTLTKRSFPVELEISDGSKTRGAAVNISPERLISHAHIGVQLAEGLSVRIVVGTKDNCVYSEPVALISK